MTKKRTTSHPTAERKQSDDNLFDIPTFLFSYTWLFMSERSLAWALFVMFSFLTQTTHALGVAFWKTNKHPALDTVFLAASWPSGADSL